MSDRVDWRQAPRRMMALLTVLAAVLGLSGCGAAKAARYVNPIYHYSVRLPPGWSPGTGNVGLTPDGVMGYIQRFNSHPSGFQIIVRTPSPYITHIPNGRILRNVPACPQTCQFIRLSISGFPGLIIRRFNALGQLFDESADVNSRRHGYEIFLPPGLSHVSKTLNRQFDSIWRSFRIAHSG